MKCKLLARAIYDYVPQNDEELGFNDNDILFITDDSDQEWWTATLKPTDTFQEHKSGLVPMTYVEEVGNHSVWGSETALLWPWQ